MKYHIISTCMYSHYLGIRKRFVFKIDVGPVDYNKYGKNEEKSSNFIIFFNHGLPFS